MRSIISFCFLLCAALQVGRAQKIVLTNDDGWAVAQIRAEFTALVNNGFDVVLSAPAENKSGTGSSTTTPTPRTEPCEFDTCPAGSPATGSDENNALINYVNAFPVDAVRFGIQTLAPNLLGSRPDFVISGSNIGNNLGPVVTGSGTVGAACEAAKEGIPSIAFSGATGLQVSYTTLSSSPDSESTVAANTYTELILKFINVLLASPAPILPANISLNVNFPPTSSCPSLSSFKFILTRINADNSATDVETCGTDHLPDETSTVQAGCFVSVSVFNATTKADVAAASQSVVQTKLAPILTCLPSK